MWIGTAPWPPCCSGFSGQARPSPGGVGCGADAVTRDNSRQTPWSSYRTAASGLSSVEASHAASPRSMASSCTCSAANAPSHSTDAVERTLANLLVEPACVEPS
ncbi:unnamed protein product [Prorocentrum cordatum]|uniref:Uncharacterized protein n=1 Tax=Prorocentrum cordatum TaxID=2364126 RepID=A0ABN9SPW9_9DINO|nr:unnamed protein product [Polarella glacialis]